MQLECTRVLVVNLSCKRAPLSRAGLHFAPGIIICYYRLPSVVAVVSSLPVICGKWRKRGGKVGHLGHYSGPSNYCTFVRKPHNTSSRSVNPGFRIYDA